MDKNEFLIRLGKRIRFLRKQKNYSLFDLADKTSKDYNSISRVERGEINPSAYFLWEISQGLDVKIDELLKIENIV